MVRRHDLLRGRLRQQETRLGRLRHDLAQTVHSLIHPPLQHITIAVTAA